VHLVHFQRCYLILFVDSEVNVISKFTENKTDNEVATAKTDLETKIDKVKKNAYSMWSTTNRQEFGALRAKHYLAKVCDKLVFLACRF
jgi:hypothetical protein